MSKNNLYENYPHLREEWDGDVEDMKKYSAYSHKKVNWKCKSGNSCHKWHSAISNRTNKDIPTGCPYCSFPVREICTCESCPNLYNNFPRLREEWDGDLDEMKKYSPGSHKRVNWKCKTKNICHQWQTSIKNRTNKDDETGCPYCSGYKTCPCRDCPNLYNDFPHLREEWDGDLEEMKMYSSGSIKKINWKCVTGKSCHKWSSSIKYRTEKTDPTSCPYCCNHKTCPCGDCPNLYNDFPHLREEWDGDLEEMKTYPCGTLKKAKWKCKSGNHLHKWEARINNRTHKDNPRGCPFCKNKTESVFFEYLCSLNYTVERERNYLWLEDKRRFDFTINNKTLIELDGRQHFIQVSNWQDPETTQDNDIDKMNKALENGLNVIRIHQEDVYYDRIDWRNKTKEAVEYMEDKTSEIRFINEVRYEHFQVE